MAIHHATVKKAEKMGVILEEVDDLVTAFWPKQAVKITGTSASDAMTQMQAILALANTGYKVRPINESRVADIEDEAGNWLAGGPHVPFAAHQMLMKGDGEWLTERPNYEEAPKDEPVLDEKIEDQKPVTKPEIARSENGVALDGAIAYKEGTPAGDNPYSTETEDDEEYDRAQKWDEAWDAAADDADAEDGEKGGSVVNERYRAKYAELGHPEHCGDWLATIFNNLVKTKEGSDVARVDAIAEANGVDLSKYNRTNPGWQGRLRMTCRNLLARVVWMADGVMRGPDGEEYKAPGDWMAAQRFKKPKSAPEPVQPEPAE